MPQAGVSNLAPVRRRQTRWRHAIAAAIFVAVLVGACGDDPDDTERITEELVDETDGALDETQAGCVADRLVSSFGDDSFREVLDAAQGTGETADDVRTQVIDIFASCDALDAVVLDRDPDDSAD